MENSLSEESSRYRMMVNGLWVLGSSARIPVRTLDNSLFVRKLLIEDAKSEMKFFLRELHKKEYAEILGAIKESRVPTEIFIWDKKSNVLDLEKAVKGISNIDLTFAGGRSDEINNFAPFITFDRKSYFIQSPKPYGFNPEEGIPAEFCFNDLKTTEELNTIFEKIWRKVIKERNKEPSPVSNYLPPSRTVYEDFYEKTPVGDYR